MSLQPFELELLGGAVERRYRRERPEVERLPWGTLAKARASPELVKLARQSWTDAAFQEHRTGAACAFALQALIAARAPLDLIAMATRFPLDEMVHVELCARLAMELGGAAPMLHDPSALPGSSSRQPHDSDALLHAAELMVRFFCVGEAVSLPLLRGTWRAASHPLVRSVLRIVVKDEAAHGAIGFAFLDWAADRLGSPERARLAEVAEDTITQLSSRWRDIAVHTHTAGATDEIHALGWMTSSEYLAVARRSLEENVRAPLRDRGIAV